MSPEVSAFVSCKPRQLLSPPSLIGFGPGQVVIADVDGDGAVDLVIANDGEQSMSNNVAPLWDSGTHRGLVPPVHAHAELLSRHPHSRRA